METVDFFPVLSLRSLAFQKLVSIEYPTDLFLPGPGYKEDLINLRCLTGFCTGTYEFNCVKDSVTLTGSEAGREVSEEDIRKNFRDDNFRIGTRLPVSYNKDEEVSEWKLGDLMTYRIGNGENSELKRKTWIEGRSLNEKTVFEINQPPGSIDRYSGHLTILLTLSFDEESLKMHEHVTKRVLCSCTSCFHCNYIYEAKALFDRI